MRKCKLSLPILGLSSSLLFTTVILAADETKTEPTKQLQQQATLPDPVAVVNGVPLSKALYEAYAQQRQGQRGIASTPEARKALTDELVLQELVVQEAKKQNLEKEAQFIQQMEMVKRNLLASAAVRKMLSEHPLSAEAIKKEYDDTKASMAANKEYKARHILVDSEDKAKELIKQIKNGGDFSELAKTHSSDSSASKGGELDWFTTDLMVEPFGEAVAKLEKGKFTEEPVKTQFGWHIIILDDVRNAPVPSLEEMQPQITQKLQSRLINEYIDKLRSAAKVEIK
jgi:peptidyl-prolyl cis-trans isomerase C